MKAFEWFFELIWHEFAFEIERSVMQYIKVPILYEIGWQTWCIWKHWLICQTCRTSFNFFFYGLMLKKEMCMLHVYLPRKVVWNFILIRKVARKKRLLILHQSLTFARADNAEWIFPLLVSSYTCSIHMWSWETCIQSLCGKMAKQQSSLVNILAKLARSEEVV